MSFRTGMPILFGFDCLADNFSFAADVGFDFVELNLNFGYCRRELGNGRLREAVKKYGRAITLHFFDEADFGSYDEIADGWATLLRRYVAPAADCGATTLVVHLIEGPVVTVGGVKHYVYEKEFETYVARLLRNLIRVDKFCKERGVTLALENSRTVPYMERTYAELRRHGFSFVFDVGHDEVCGNLPRRIFEKTDFYGVKEFHIHDVKTVGGEKRDHVSLGEGVVDLSFYKRIAEARGADCLLELKSVSDLTASAVRFAAL